MFPVRADDPTTQAGQLLTTLTHEGVRFDSVMIDIEGDDWAKYSTVRSSCGWVACFAGCGDSLYHHVPPVASQASNQVFITALRAGLEAGGARVVIYCGLDWNNYFGPDFHTFSDLPVAYAHYDNVPGFYDAVDNPYGGWSAPTAKQFWDGADGEQVCGTGALDWDWTPTPFWTTER